MAPAGSLYDFYGLTTRLLKSILSNDFPGLVPEARRLGVVTQRIMDKIQLSIIHEPAKIHALCYSFCYFL
jgi:hypothetical protein